MYAIKAMTDRQASKVGMGEEEQELLRRWNNKDSKLNLSREKDGRVQEGGKRRKRG